MNWYLLEKTEAASKGHCKHSPCVDILEWAIWRDMSEEEIEDYNRRMRKCREGK